MEGPRFPDSFSRSMSRRPDSEVSRVALASDVEEFTRKVKEALSVEGTFERAGTAYGRGTKGGGEAIQGGEAA